MNDARKRQNNIFSCKPIKQKKINTNKSRLLSEVHYLKVFFL